MKAIIGLGNPGLKYSNTRHNVGFMLLDRIVKEKNCAYRDGFRGKVAEEKLNGQRLFFLKPYTYMNLSGIAIKQLVGYYKIPAENILVLHDDMDLPLGKIRLRSKGSAGGHNGLKSVIAELGTQNFWRLKIGVGRPNEHVDVIGHVLSGFSGEEKKVLEEVFERAHQAALLWLDGKETEAMNRFN